VTENLPAVIGEHLSKAAKTRATNAIQNVHLAFFEKGGMRDTYEKLRDQQAGAGNHIYALAVYAAEQEKTLDKAARLFRDMCAYAEATYKQEYEVTNLEESLPVWKVYKSNILKGIRLKLSPAEYASEYELRKAVAEIERERPVKRIGHKAGIEELEEMLSTTSLRDTMRLLIARAIFSVENLKRGKSKEAQRVMQNAVEKLSALVDENQEGNDY
jgi:hypothetical protein